MGTVSIEKSEKFSSMLKRKGVKHVVLNAKYHAQEAEIVAQAGRAGTVTIATNMAGRGTDILLGGNPEFMARQQRWPSRWPNAAWAGRRSVDDEEFVAFPPRELLPAPRREPARHLSRPSRRRPTATTRRSSRLAVFTSSAPNAMRPAVSTTSCAAAPGVRATRVRRGSISRSKTTSCASSWVRTASPG